MAYTTKAKIESRLGQELPDSISTEDLSVYIDEAKAYIDAYTDTTFEATAPSTKIYSTRHYSQFIVIDPAVSVSKVEYLTNRNETGDTWAEYDTDTYRAEPENTTPKTMLKMTGYGDGLWMEGGTANIRVTGVFGNSATVPNDVAMVATGMVCDMLRDRGDISSPLKSERLGDVALTYDTMEFSQKRNMYNLILDKYKNIGDIGL